LEKYVSSNIIATVFSFESILDQEIIKKIFFNDFVRISCWLEFDASSIKTILVSSFESIFVLKIRKNRNLFGFCLVYLSKTSFSKSLIIHKLNNISLVNTKRASFSHLNCRFWRRRDLRATGSVMDDVVSAGRTGRSASGDTVRILVAGSGPERTDRCRSWTGLCAVALGSC